MANRKPPKRPRPNVSTTRGGEFVYEWSEKCQDWVTVKKPQNWLEKLLKLSPEPLIIYPDKECS